MAEQTPPQSGKTKAEQREERLKAALKANMGRRKAQARARSGPDKAAESTAGQTKKGE